MPQVMKVRDAIRDFLRKFDEITIPVLRFVFSYILFTSINKLFGYSELFGRGIVIFLLALICSLASDTVAVLLGGVVMMINGVSVSAEIGIMLFVVVILMYCSYMRIFPDCAWVLAFVPIMFMWKLYFVIPVIVVIFAGAAGIVPTVFGALFYYIAMAIREIKDGNMLEDKEFQAYNYVIDSVIKNKAILSVLIVFAVVIMITYILYKLPYDYAFYVAILASGLLNILVSLLVDGATDAGISMGQVVGGSLLGILIGALVQVCKGLLDYAHKENVQFEDDDYFYYVKAVPKFTSKKKTEKPSVSDVAKQAMSGHTQTLTKENKSSVAQTEQPQVKQTAAAQPMANQQIGNPLAGTNPAKKRPMNQTENYRQDGYYPNGQ